MWEYIWMLQFRWHQCWVLRCTWLWYGINMFVFYDLHHHRYYEVLLKITLMEDNNAEEWVAWWRLGMEILSLYWPFVRGIHWSPVDSLHKGASNAQFDVFIAISQKNYWTIRWFADYLRCYVITHWQIRCHSSWHQCNGWLSCTCYCCFAIKMLCY